MNNHTIYHSYHGEQKPKVIVLNHLGRSSFQLYRPQYDTYMSKKERLEEHTVPYQHPCFYKMQIQKFLTK